MRMKTKTILSGTMHIHRQKRKNFTDLNFTVRNVVRSAMSRYTKQDFHVSSTGDRLMPNKT